MKNKQFAVVCFQNSWYESADQKEGYSHAKFDKPCSKSA